MITFELVEDVKKLAELASEIWHEYWLEILSIEQIDYMIEKYQSEFAISNQIKTENYTYFFILENSEIVGYTGLSKKDGFLFLSKLYIKRDYRHIGVGTKTFDFIKSYARNNAFNKIILTVNKNNKNTIDAYNKWGFAIVDAVVTDIGNGFVMDDYIMAYLF